MATLLWLHSGGSFNKEPENDLGNYPSQFEISGEPPEEANVFNNLFDDVTPLEAQNGSTDYRCFYLWNDNVTSAIINLSVQLGLCFSCGSSISYGSDFANDVQKITIACVGTEDKNPDIGGFVIFDTEFGPPFTIYYNGSWTQFGADLQTALNMQPWCDTVTVTGLNPFIITFQGGSGNRRVQLIRVVQNNLSAGTLCRYNTQIYQACNDWNRYQATQVKVVQKISSTIAQIGTLRIYNPLTGLWDSYDYNGHNDYIFFLVNPLQFNLVGFLGSCPPVYTYPGDPNLPSDDNLLLDDSQNWQRWFPSPVNTDEDVDTDQFEGLEAGENTDPSKDNDFDIFPSLSVPWGVIEVTPCPGNNMCQVCVTKVADGGPINTIAAPILTENSPPDLGTSSFTSSTLPIPIGNLRPNEGFFLWVQRTTAPSTTPCFRDYFTITATGTQVTWPLITP
jgi:hypothetical protein